MSSGVVYKITNINDGKCYIGKTSDPKKRFYQQSFRFDPEKHFFEILAYHDSEENLKNAEIYWIWFFDSIKKGYNRVYGSGMKKNLKKKIEIAYIGGKISKDLKNHLTLIAKKEGLSINKLLIKIFKEYIKKYLEVNKNDVG